MSHAVLRVEEPRDELRARRGRGPLIGGSAPMIELRQTIAKVAGSGATVLVSGESGTGKELVARALHETSDRARAPFVPVNCGALVESLLESELFGHVRGAFTGADRDKEGVFVAADGGTLFLDEIGELPLALQPKLLRALQDGEIKPVGGGVARRVDVRVVACTNRDLPAEIAAGRFREDLFYRLAVIGIDVPPLRARREDIPDLAASFAAAAARRAGIGPVRFTGAAAAWMEAQRWPGNVRQLENCIERAVVLASSSVIDVDDLRPHRTGSFARGTLPPIASDDPVATLFELERNHILRVLELCENQKSKAAALLGINRTTLWKKLRTYGL
jgi:DNA-binding NtrC family response regulator